MPSHLPGHRRPVAARRPAACCPPRVEALEDRYLLSVYTVTTTLDAVNDTNAGEVTLRDVLTAIDTQQASGNAAAGTAGNTVRFAIGATGTTPTINLASPLPPLTHTALIDGWSQGGTHYAGPPLIVLNGAGAGGSADGLEIDAGGAGSVVRGLVVGQFGGNGIEVRGASGVLLRGDYVGVGADGSSSFGNLGDGILIDGGAAHNTVGPGNVLSDNGNVGLSTGSGLEIAGAGTSGNLVVGNFIGTDRSGTVALGNVSDGILIDGGAAHNTVGGTAPGSANVIAGGFNVSVPNGGSSQAGAVFSLSAPTIVGDQARFDVEVSYTDIPPSEMVFLGVDYRDSSAALEPINPNTGMPDYSAFNFAPSSTLGPGWAPVAGAPAGESQYQTPPPKNPQLITPLQPNATYFVGTLTYDLSKFGIQPSQLLDVSLAGSDTTIGTEVGGAFNTFNFVNPSFSPGEQALVPGTGTAGIDVSGPGTNGNVVLGNLIGTNAAGTKDLGHLTDDVLIQGGAAGNTVGGAAPHAGNVIAGGDDGVSVSGSSGNLVQGNRIGTNAGGTADLGNALTGVLLENAAASNTVSGNVIAFNGEGVVIGGSPSDLGTKHDTVLGNSIYGNAGPGIDLGYLGSVTGGSHPTNLPNDNQSAPAITALTLHSVSGTLTSVPNTNFHIEVYASPVGGPPGQAEFFLGALQVKTGPAGTVGFTLPVASLPLGMVFTATATNLATGDTSAVSPVGTQLLILSEPVITSSSGAQTVALSAQLYSARGPVAGGRVVFSVPGLPGVVSGVANAQGIVRVSFPVPGGVAAGSYTIRAAFAGEEGIAPAAAADILTILARPRGVARRWLR